MNWILSTQSNPDIQADRDFWIKNFDIIYLEYFASSGEINIEKLNTLPSNIIIITDGTWRPSREEIDKYLNMMKWVKIDTNNYIGRAANWKWRDLFDHAYVINLEHRTDRYNHMMNELKRSKINNYEFFKAIRPQYSDILEWNPLFCQSRKNKFDSEKFIKYKIGSLGCMLSHIRIMQDALNRGFDRILIFEDDTEFLQQLDVLLENIEEIENDFDFLYLTVNNVITPKYYSPHFSIPKTGYVSSAYIITRKTMQYILKKIVKYSQEYDIFLIDKIQRNKKIKCFCHIPYITKQLDGYSDILNTQVDYLFG